MVNTDERKGYSRVGQRYGRVHRAVDHSGPKSTSALDLDGDGVGEVHCNAQEGLWTGLRVFQGRFRAVSEWYLGQLCTRSLARRANEERTTGCQSGALRGNPP